MNLSKVNQLITLPKIHIRSSLIFGLIILTALLAFETFNYSTTEYALHDLLGELRFAGLRWATILAVAFCGIDFAGIARLFTPRGEDEARETWYLFGAWLLAATMNALLTWWGVSMAIVNHNIQSASIVATDTLVNVVPVFVAVMVWLIRILIIGTISAAADHLVGNSATGRPARSAPIGDRNTRQIIPPVHKNGILTPQTTFSRSAQARSEQRSTAKPEPTYQSFSFDASHSHSSREGEGNQRS